MGSLQLVPPGLAMAELCCSRTGLPTVRRMGAMLGEPQPAQRGDLRTRTQLSKSP